MSAIAQSRRQPLLCERSWYNKLHSMCKVNSPLGLREKQGSATHCGDKQYGLRSLLVSPAAATQPSLQQHLPLSTSRGIIFKAVPKADSHTTGRGEVMRELALSLLSTSSLVHCSRMAFWDISNPLTATPPALAACTSQQQLTQQANEAHYLQDSI